MGLGIHDVIGEKRFDDLATQIESRHEEMVIEPRTLAALRDTLLPKLIAGEVRVGETEELVEALV